MRELPGRNHRPHTQNEHKARIEKTGTGTLSTRSWLDHGLLMACGLFLAGSMVHDLGRLHQHPCVRHPSPNVLPCLKAQDAHPRTPPQLKIVLLPGSLPARGDGTCDLKQSGGLRTKAHDGAMLPQ
jgi:hypothetical protein